MGALTDRACASYPPPTTVLDLDGAALDYSDWRVAEGKAHGPPCERCAVRARCEGPWREYPAAFGWGEFVPLDRDPLPLSHEAPAGAGANGDAGAAPAAASSEVHAS